MGIVLPRLRQKIMVDKQLESVYINYIRSVEETINPE
jgi:hypothetical protein